MLKIERILCPIDFSAPSAKAYEYACSLARRYDATLYLQHTIETLIQAYPYYAFPGTVYKDMIKGAEDRLRKMVNDPLTKKVRTEVTVQVGFAADSILAFAEDLRADLIVMGTHGRRALDRLVMGSVTEHVVRRALCPVLAVRKPAHDFINPTSEAEPVLLRKILFCTDFSKAAEAALGYALSIAQEYNAELSLLHVLEETFEAKRGPAEEEEAQLKLEALIPADAHNWCAIKPVVQTGAKPYEEIIQFAVQHQTDLAVLGVRGRSAVDMAIFGSTTNRVLQLGPCPVLVVQGGAGQ